MTNPIETRYCSLLLQGPAISNQMLQSVIEQAQKLAVLGPNHQYDAAQQEQLDKLRTVVNGLVTVQQLFLYGYINETISPGGAVNVTELVRLNTEVSTVAEGCCRVHDVLMKMHVLEAPK